MAISMDNFERRIWEVLLAGLMLCGGTAVLVLIYMWFAWYASLYALRLRVRAGIDNGGGSPKGGLSVSDFQKLPTFICISHLVEPGEDEKLGSDTDGYDKKSRDGFYVSEDLECTVCLDQFKDGERCLVMPACRHCFHVHCAQAWLSKQPLCPVCRSTAHPQQQQGLSSNDNTVIDISS